MFRGSICSERNNALSRLLRELADADPSSHARAVPVLEVPADRMLERKPVTVRVGTR